MVHFNGDGFDIPFLQKRCKHFNLPYSFSDVASFDIYKKVKPYRNLLGLDSLKQKSIEQFLGIARTDKYNGGQLIEVYKDYLMTHEQNLYDLLILHNEDDLKRHAFHSSYSKLSGFSGTSLPHCPTRKLWMNQTQTDTAVIF